MVRLSVGIEDIRDILADLDQAIATAGNLSGETTEPAKGGVDPVALAF